MVDTYMIAHKSIVDRKDQKTLESLRMERQAKIDELKEKTNFYATQQLIQALNSSTISHLCTFSLSFTYPINHVPLRDMILIQPQRWQQRQSWHQSWGLKLGWKSTLETILKRTLLLVPREMKRKFGQRGWGTESGPTGVPKAQVPVICSQILAL